MSTSSVQVRFTRGSPALVMIGTAAALWSVMMSTTIPTSLYPLYEARMGFSALTVTAIVAAYALGVMLTLLTFGQIADRYPRKGVLGAAVALAAIAAAIFERVPSLPMMLSVRFVSGIAAGLATGTATATLLEVAAGRRRGAIIAIAANAGGLGCGTLFGGLLAQWAPAPLQSPWRLVLALLAAAALLLIMMLEPARIRPVDRSWALPRIYPSVRRHFRHAAAVSGSGFAVLGLLTSVTGLFLGRSLGIHAPALTGFIVFLAFAGIACGQFLTRRLPNGLALPLACGALTLAAVAIGYALISISLAPLIVGALLNGFATGVAMADGVARIQAGSPPEARVRTTSAFFAVLYAMLSIPVVGVGLLIAATDLRIAGVASSVAVAALAIGVHLSQRARPVAAS